MDRIAPFTTTVCGIEELPGHCEAGVSHLVSILDPGWPIPDAFGDYGAHDRLELRFHDVIEEVPEMIAPGEADVVRILEFGHGLTAGPAHLLVHCHAGISRSTATMTLLLAQAMPGWSASEVMEEVLRIRAKAWPNLRILEFGDALLGRGGTLVAAAPVLYRTQLERRPELAEIMTVSGRGREVAAARG